MMQEKILQEMSAMNYRNGMIIEYVRQYNEKIGDGESYNVGLKEMDKTSLENITVEDIKRVMEPFLYKWGGMGRVLGRSKYKNWQIEIRKEIQANYKKLELLKTNDLADIDLMRWKSEIKECYENFKIVLGPIAAAKSLHLICPAFFSPWDNAIAEAAKMARNSEDEIKIEELSGEDYYRYMQQIQVLIKTNKDIIMERANKYEKSKIKIVDDCLWWATHRPLSSILK